MNEKSTTKDILGDLAGHYEQARKSKHSGRFEDSNNGVFAVCKCGWVSAETARPHAQRLLMKHFKIWQEVGFSSDRQSR